MVEGLWFQCQKRTLVLLYQICGQSYFIETIIATRRNNKLTSREF